MWAGNRSRLAGESKTKGIRFWKTSHTLPARKTDAAVQAKKGRAMRLWPFVLVAIGVVVFVFVAVKPHPTPYDDADAAIRGDDDDRALAILLPLAERGEAEACLATHPSAMFAARAANEGAMVRP